MTKDAVTRQSGVTKLMTQFEAIDTSEELPFSLLHADKNITLILYRPGEEDLQTPHDQDEYYFVASGSADVAINEALSPVSVGDAIFVAAFDQHKFIDATADFSCWGLFYGPVHSAHGEATS